MYVRRIWLQLYNICAIPILKISHPTFTIVGLLGFEDTTDYAYLSRSFHDLFVRKGFQYDNVFDWTILQQQMAQSSRAIPRLPLEQAPAPAAIDMVRESMMAMIHQRLLNLQEREKLH